MPKDYYSALGLPKNASSEEIRKAFRRLARKYHPDVNPGNKDAEKHFKKISEAYEVLSDEENRQKYDAFGDNWRHADQSQQAGRGQRFDHASFTPENIFRESNIGNIFDGLFGGKMRNAPEPKRSSARLNIQITLEEAYGGTTRTITFGGKGPRSKSVEATIPQGVENGAKINLTHGHQSVILTIKVVNHEKFDRKGSDLYSQIPVPLYDAILGGEVNVETLSGNVVLSIPSDTPNGKRFRLAGKGMPLRKLPSKKGNLYVSIHVQIPTNLSEEERESFSKLRLYRSVKSAND